MISFSTFKRAVSKQMSKNLNEVKWWYQENQIPPHDVRDWSYRKQLSEVTVGKGGF